MTGYLRGPAVFDVLDHEGRSGYPADGAAPRVGGDGEPAPGRQSCRRWSQLQPERGDPVGRRLLHNTDVSIAHERGTIDRSALNASSTRAYARVKCYVGQSMHHANHPLSSASIVRMFDQFKNGGDGSRPSSEAVRNAKEPAGARRAGSEMEAWLRPYPFGQVGVQMTLAGQEPGHQGPSNAKGTTATSSRRRYACSPA